MFYDADARRGELIFAERIAGRPVTRDDSPFLRISTEKVHLQSHLLLLRASVLAILFLFSEFEREFNVLIRGGTYFFIR